MNETKRFREMDIIRITEALEAPNAEALARKAMNSFYRLGHFNERLVTIENDERLYNFYKGRRLEAMEKRFDNWYTRLNEYFKPFNMVVKFYGIFPTLETADGRNVTYGHYYR